jgi:hypothetical protein
MPSDPKPPPPPRDPLGKLIVGTFFFLIFGVLLAVHARRAQLAGQRLALGDLNASLSPAAGYAVAGVMLVLGVAYAYRTRAVLRRRPPGP